MGGKKKGKASKAGRSSREDKTYVAPAHIQVINSYGLKPDAVLFWPSRQLGTYRKPRAE